MIDAYLQDVLDGAAFALFDGAMGTMLVREGLQGGELPELLCLSDPDRITAVHRAYVEAGSKFVTTNTFGANRLKLGDAASVDDVFAAAVRCARDAGAAHVAADMGPTGELIFPMGELTFTEAYELFAEQARAAEAAGADVIIVETMADVLEAAAAVIAAKLNCSLPVFASMTFTASGRTFLGTEPRTAALALSVLGADVLGVNCSAGPSDLQPVVGAMLEVASCPVLVQANAGLPQVVDGQTIYTLAPADYAEAVRPMIDAGASVVGGCCGTDPDYIRELACVIAGLEPARRASSREQMLVRACEVAQGDGRDAEIMDLLLEAGDCAEMREALADEFDD